jgi:hypothetical protein
MPLIHRVTTDMFEFADVMDFQVNPVNLQGAPGGNLSLEFRKRVPDELFFSKYREACRDGTLRIGTVQVLEETGHSWGIINFPTKRHYANPSDKEDIARGLEALRDILKTDRYRYSAIGIPMLGIGLGAQNYETVYPMMIDYLGDLDATVFLSMAPDKTDLKPKYLTIAGPLSYGLKEDEQRFIDDIIDKVLTHWNATLDDYTGIVSGGYPGVDAYIGGEHYGKEIESTYAFRKTGKAPLVVKPNPSHGLGASMHLGNLLGEIGDDTILFKPPGHNNNRLSIMQTWLEADKQRREREGLIPRRLAISGEKKSTPKSESVLIPVVASDLPY